jgi:hypothetical protein
MAEPHVISALKDKRARLAADIEAAQARLTLLKGDLASVIACLRMFGADVCSDEIAPKRTFGKNPAVLPKGAGGPLAVDVLRETGEAFDCRELAVRVLTRLGKPAEPGAVAMLSRTIQGTFSRHRTKQVEYDRSTWPGKWRLIKRAGE